MDNSTARDDRRAGYVSESPQAEASGAEPPAAVEGRAMRRQIRLAVVVSALGYFVDVYDLLLFNIIRLPSLRGLGITGEAARQQGLLLVNMQMVGMLVGGLLWGVTADKRGRLSVLFGSILLYSLTNIANGFVTDMTMYSVLRFLSGIGLAGELGAGITLVSEIMPQESRGYGTTLVASFGLLGAVAAALVGDLFDWRASYFIGGGLGLILLALRVGVYESGMFVEVKKQTTKLGSLVHLFSSKRRALCYISLVFLGVPVWYTTGILVGFSPEIGRAMGMPVSPQAGRAVMYCYIGLSVGDLATGALSQIIRSRKKVLLGFLALTAVSWGIYFLFARTSIEVFYAVCVLMGFSIGYWAVYITVSSEHFGTNLRATTATSVPNIVRAAVVPVTLAFKVLDPTIGVVGSTFVVAATILTLALISLTVIEETYGRDLDFIEH